jgi:hypothetical protein
MHAQQGQEILLSQKKGVEASPAIVAQQGFDTQLGATEEGADNIGGVNGTWSSDVLLELLNLPFGSMLSSEVIPNILPSASGNQLGASTGATTDTMLIQPSNICEAVNSGVTATGAIDPPASATGSIGDGLLVAPSGGKGSAPMPMADLDLTIPHDRRGLTDIEMTGATIRASHNQVLLSLSGGVHRVPASSLVGIMDGEDQTAARESAGGNGPLTASTEMKVDMLDENNGLETSLSQKRPLQSSMVTPRISWHTTINEAQLPYINSDLDAIKGIKNTCPRSGGNGKIFVFMMVNHKNQGESPSTKVYECI